MKQSLRALLIPQDTKYCTELCLRVTEEGRKKNKKEEEIFKPFTDLQIDDTESHCTHSQVGKSSLCVHGAEASFCILLEQHQYTALFAVQSLLCHLLVSVQNGELDYFRIGSIYGALHCFP